MALILLLISSQVCAQSTEIQAIRERAIQFAKQQRFAEAIPLFELYASGTLALHGPQTHQYLMALNELAETHLKNNQPEYALAVLSKVSDQSPSRNLIFSFVLADRFRIKGLAHNQLDSFAQSDLYFRKLDSASAIFSKEYPTVYLDMKYDQFTSHREAQQWAQARSVGKIIIGFSEMNNYPDKSFHTILLTEVANVSGNLDLQEEEEKFLDAAVQISIADSMAQEEYYTLSEWKRIQYLEKMGRYEEALASLHKLTSLILSREGKSYSYFAKRQFLAVILYRLDRLNEARRELNDIIRSASLPADDPLQILLTNTLGIILSDERNFQGAIEMFTKASNELEKQKSNPRIIRDLFTIYQNMARASAAMGDVPKAEQYLNQSLQLPTGQLSFSQTTATSQLLVNINKQMGNLKACDSLWSELTQSLLDHAYSGFEFMNESEKSSLWMNHAAILRNFMSFAIERSETNPSILDEAYNVRVRGKSLLLKNTHQLRRTILNSQDTALIRQYNRWVSLLYQHAAAVESRRGREADSLLKLSQRIEKEFTTIANDKTNLRTPSPDWVTIQKSLKRGEAAIEIIRFRHYGRYVTDSLLYVALILTPETKNHPALVVFPEGRLLEKRWFNWYKNAIAQQLQDTLSYHQFWKPLEQALRGVHKIYLSPDGVFHKVNLSTILQPNGRYVLDDKNIVLVSNTGDVTSFKNSKVILSKKEGVLIGDPDFGQPDETPVDRLPGTRIEVNRIAQIFKNNGMDTRVHTDSAARKEVLNQVKHPAVLHIATHGYFSEATSDVSLTQSLFQSGLILARTNNSNGRFTAYEASNLDLEGTELVTLSACETAQGKIENGEGVYGLQRAFMSSGARNLIVSLWKVNDRATQELMTEFYDRWTRSKSIEEALRRTQINLRRKYPHPFYWGGFVLMKN